MANTPQWIPQKLTNNTYNTTHGPALAAYDNKLYMAYKGSGTDTRIWYTYYDDNKYAHKDESKWEDSAKPLSSHHTSCSPALAVLGENMYMVWKGGRNANEANGNNIYYSVFNRTNNTWTAPVATGASTSHRPALAVFRNRLYMAWKNSGNYGISYSSRSSSSSWTSGVHISGLGINTTHGPALACFRDGDAETLYLVWKGSADRKIWYASLPKIVSYVGGIKTSKEGTWVAHNAISTADDTSCEPALAVYSKYWLHSESYDPIHKDLYLLRKGWNDSSIYASTFRLKETDEIWTQRSQIQPVNTIQTSDTPAISEYNNKLFMAWKRSGNDTKIWFSHLDTGSYDYAKNIFDQTRPGKPVVRQEDLAVLRIETQNLVIVSGFVDNITVGMNYTNIGSIGSAIGSIGSANLGEAKVIDNAATVLLDHRFELFQKPPGLVMDIKNPVRTPDLTSTLLARESQRQLSQAVDKLIAMGVELVFYQGNMDETVLSMLAKEGIVAVHGLSEAEMNDLAQSTGASIIGNLESITHRDIGITASLKEQEISKDARLYFSKFQKPRLKKTGSGSAFIILHFPPQSFGERAFFQVNSTKFDDESPKTSGKTVNEIPDPPIQARIAHESRLVFEVPNGFDIEYSLAAVLEACKGLPLKVSTASTPQLPDAETTSIEMPWRLILSPNNGAYWRHATRPVSSPSNTTELWHTQMVTPRFEGGKIVDEIISPYPDEKRTTKAIWALSGIGSEFAETTDGRLAPMQSALPKNSTELPASAENPFLMTLDNFDRYQIAYLTSHNNLDGNKPPNQLETNTMMLSSLGGWLDLRGAWDAPGLSVEQWSHRATMGRDHYVRVVYRGFLYPFGHRVSLIKVSERKFNKTVSGDYAAFLHQRLYMVINEKERVFAEHDSLFKVATANDAKTSIARKFPFKSVKILTEVTPDLAKPDEKYPIYDLDASGNLANPLGQQMFWPHVVINSFAMPFRFQCSAIDLEGRRVTFDLPMIFMDSTKALPRTGPQLEIPYYDGAEKYAQIAMRAYAGMSQLDSSYNTANLQYQRVSLADSKNPGDTSVQVDKMQFGGFAENNNQSLRKFSLNLTRPIWAPQVDQIDARIDAIASLSGAKRTHKLNFSLSYLQNALGSPGNKGEVFVDILPGGPNLDFSSQGDKSGGFIQPNLTPRALSRLAGPVMGTDAQLQSFINGKMAKGAGFPVDESLLGGLPMPLIFGCIPLGDIIKEVDFINNGLNGIPKFISEAGSKIDSFLGDLGRLLDIGNNLQEQITGIAKAALAAHNDNLKDLLAQSLAFTSAQQTHISAAINSVLGKNEYITGAFNIPNLSNLLANSGYIQSITNLVNAADQSPGGVPFPAGFKQSVRSISQKLQSFAMQLGLMPQLYAGCTALVGSLNDIIGNPAATASLLGNPSELSIKLNNLKTKIASFREQLALADLLDGAPRNILLSCMAAVEEVLGDIASIVEMIAGDELTARFDWNPEIESWPNSSSPLFRANDKKGLLVAVEAKVKKNGTSSPKISVLCSLKHFDLILIGSASFLELSFEKIEFSVDSAAKMEVDVLLSNIKFLGVLSFVEAFRDLIPLDGFSDPPYLDITSKGIDAGFSISLPSICFGVLNIANLSLSAGFSVPFIGEPLSVRFYFCSREQPFMLTVYGLGGGGFFGIAVNPKGVQLLEAALEFGAGLAVDFGVARGKIHAMAGIYYRMEDDAAQLTGYFRMGGSVSVLGLITASIELYLDLTYQFNTGKVIGSAQLSIQVSVFLFSVKVTIRAERKLAGSNGDPTFRQMLGYRPDLGIEEELNEISADADFAMYPWREYLEAFTYEEDY